jgi:hypothetical protein
MTPKEFLETKKKPDADTVFYYFLESNSEIETSFCSPIADE